MTELSLRFCLFHLLKKKIKIAKGKNQIIQMGEKVEANNHQIRLLDDGSRTWSRRDKDKFLRPLRLMMGSCPVPSRRLFF